MAFVVAAFTKIANLNALTETDPSPGLFVYDAQGDNVATVVGAGYFNGIRDQITPNTQICCLCSNGVRWVELSVPDDGVSDVTVSLNRGVA